MATTGAHPPVSLNSVYFPGASMAGNALGTVGSLARTTFGGIMGALDFTFSWAGLEYGLAKLGVDMAESALAGVAYSVGGGGPLMRYAVAVGANAMSGGLVIGYANTPK